MEIQFINHASVVIRTGDCTIFTDPWFFGSAFNDSWSLIPEPDVTTISFDEIDYLFISHEHPDHFHFPTLKSLPLAFKKRVQILFQKNNSDKMVDAFKKLGFEHIILLKHREKKLLKGTTAVEIYQIGSMDSALIVANDKHLVININDCEPNDTDCQYLLKKYGKADVVLNQFSMAGYEGFPDYDHYLKRNANRKLTQLVENHRDLQATVTIPFASNVYFSCDDNKYVNDYANRPWDALETMKKENFSCCILFPGDAYKIGDPINNEKALANYRSLYSSFPYSFSTVKPVTKEELFQAWNDFCQNLHSKYPNWILRKLGTISVRINDLGLLLSLNVVKKTIIELPFSSTADLEVNSQPLHFGFKHPYGIQTLGVSARVIVHRFANWRWYRLLASLNNAEIFLKPGLLFTRRNIQFIAARLMGSGLSQLIHKLKIRGFVR